MGRTSTIVVVSAAIVCAIAGTPALARERKTCMTYPTRSYDCKSLCDAIMKGTNVNRVDAWQSVAASSTGLRPPPPRRVGFLPGQVRDVASCEVNPRPSFFRRPCSVKICLVIETLYKPGDVRANQTIPKLQPVPTPRTGSPPAGQGGASNALTPGLLDGDSGFAAAGPAGAGSPVGRASGGGSTGSATSYQAGTGSSGVFRSTGGGSSGAPGPR
jgi:hypothetical protein